MCALPCVLCAVCCVHLQVRLLALELPTAHLHTLVALCSMLDTAAKAPVRGTPLPLSPLVQTRFQPWSHALAGFAELRGREGMWRKCMWREGMWHERTWLSTWYASTGGWEVGSAGVGRLVCPSRIIFLLTH